MNVASLKGNLGVELPLLVHLVRVLGLLSPRQYGAVVSAGDAPADGDARTGGRGGTDGGECAAKGSEDAQLGHGEGRRKLK